MSLLSAVIIQAIPGQPGWKVVVGRNFPQHDARAEAS